jgi:phosphohistidine swiveling domain-containing protein
MRDPLSPPKWTLPEGSTLSRITREELHKTIRRNLERLGPDVSWAEAVSTRTMDLLSEEDGRQTAKQIFQNHEAIEGRKLFAGCEVAVRDYPDIYVLRSAAEAVELPELPEGALGDGDNAFQNEVDVEGAIMVVREIRQVDELMREGVPEGTIGVIDDAGGTMTAPILEEFEAILCLAGTVHSHLAIISREFGVPVLMNVRLGRPLENGERVKVEYSAEAQNIDAYYGGEMKPRARVLPAEGSETR